MSATLLAPSATRNLGLPRWLALLPLFAGVALMGALTAPLAMAVYGLLLLGVAHNLSEIRYIALRWGDRLRASSLLPMLVVLIGSIAVTRLLSIAGWVTGDAGRLIEIVVMYAILGVALRHGLPRSAESGAGSGPLSVLGVFGWGVLAVAAMLSFSFPQWHVMVFAHLHNLLPWWFVREAVPEEAKLTVDVVAGILLVAIPLLLLCGLGDGASLTPGAAMGGDWVAFSRGLMLPAWSGTLQGERLLRMFAYAQLVHFLIWVLLMSRLLPASMSYTVQPTLRRLDPWLIAVAVMGAAAFARDFATTRLWYPVFATWHAYLELPILVALILNRQRESGSPAYRLE